MAQSEKPDVTPVDEVKDVLQRLVTLADLYGEGPNQEVRDALDRARVILAKATAVKA